MSEKRFKIVPAVYLMIIKNEEILLLKRANTNYMEGFYSLPAGHVDGNESATNAMIREAKEEIGIDIKYEDLEMKTSTHSKFPDRENIDWFFTASKWQGEIINNEPDKCSELKFYPINELPENIIPHVKHSIECYTKGISYSEFGWD